MRHQGKITEWKDDRGFGFITPNGGGTKVFVHFSAVRKGAPRPKGNELVTYELGPADPKGPRAIDITYVERMHAIFRDEVDASRKGGTFGWWISAVFFIAIAAFVWQRYTAHQSAVQRSLATPQSSTLPAAARSSLLEQVAPDSKAGAFKCEGKIHCSQMASCEEAKFYLRHCPGVKIDGDGDGIPCERGPCGR